VASVILEAVSKVYADGTPAVQDLTLEIDDGEFAVLVGPSGCGKTTALRMVAGLEAITDGEVRIARRRVNDLAPRDRDIAMVFQNYALYPHMDVEHNMSFGLRMRGVSRDEQQSKARQIAELLGLAEHLGRRPSQLSGGQRQRVAMGRALIRQPQVFLMDEPLSNLDAKLRGQMRSEIAEIQQRFGTTTIYVTHDQVEALTMGHRIALMRHGVLQQFGTPKEIYESPANLFVASFIGSPTMNFIEAAVEMPDGPTLRVGDQLLRLPRQDADRWRVGRYAGQRLALGIRPEGLHAASSDDLLRLTGTVRSTELIGPETLVHTDVKARPVIHEALDTAVEVIPGTAEEATVVGRMPPFAQFEPGEPIELGIDTRHVHLFDLTNGTALA
jgi:multiple sugar transport system ATP-binding protein